MLRLKAAARNVEDFTTGTFRPVIADSTADPALVKRVLLCAGKVYHDLVAQRDKSGDTATAIIRLEQLYPLDADQLSEALAPYSDAEVVWVQEEPLNQGAWSRMSLALPRMVGSAVSVVARAAAASPASGLASVHHEEQVELVTRAFDS